MNQVHMQVYFADNYFTLFYFLSFETIFCLNLSIKEILVFHTFFNET